MRLPVSAHREVRAIMADLMRYVSPRRRKRAWPLLVELYLAGVAYEVAKDACTPKSAS